MALITLDPSVRPDVRLVCTGRLITHKRQPNGSQDAIPATGSYAMTYPEHDEYSRIFDPKNSSELALPLLAPRNEKENSEIFERLKGVMMAIVRAEGRTKPSPMMKFCIDSAVRSGAPEMKIASAISRGAESLAKLANNYENAAREYCAPIARSRQRDNWARVTKASADADVEAVRG